MQTRINKPTKYFSQISNGRITDTNISDAGYRLLCYIEMQPDNWTFYKEEIKKRFNWGEDKYLTAIKSIKQAGYIDHYPVRNDKGSITHRSIDLYYEPTTVQETHPPANPPHGKPPVYNNTDINNTNINNKEDKKEKRKNFSPPSLEEVIDYFKESGYKEEVAKKAFNVYNVADWYDTKGNKIKNRRQKMHSVWFTDQNKAPKETPKDNSHIEKLYNFDHLIGKI